MKMLRAGKLGAAACILVAGFAVAQAQPASAPVSGFEQLKTLIGTWEGTSASGKALRVTYEAASGGTALMERLKPADEAEMVTMYTPDGDRVAVTHYCSTGNQPHMRTEPITGTVTLLTFSFVRATNLASPDAGHMSQLVVTLQDHDHFTQEWTWSDKGKMGTEVFHFTRKS